MDVSQTRSNICGALVTTPPPPAIGAEAQLGNVVWKRVTTYVEKRESDDKRPTTTETRIILVTPDRTDTSPRIIRTPWTMSQRTTTDVSGPDTALTPSETMFAVPELNICAYCVAKSAKVFISTDTRRHPFSVLRT